MKTLRERQYRIAKKLLLAVNPTSVDELCELFSVSLRTVRYDLKEVVEFLIQYGIELQFKNNQGYFIKYNDKQQLTEILNSIEIASDTDEERTGYVKSLIYLLSSTRDRLGTSYLAGKLYVSQSMISRLIQDVGKYTNSAIKICTSKDGYQIESSETELRRYLVKNLEELFSKYHNLIDYYEELPDALKSSISKDRYLVLINTVNRLNKEFQVWLSEQSFIHLVSYVLVMEIRTSIASVELNDEFASELLKAEREYAIKLLEGLFTSYTKSEVDGVVELLISKGIFINQLGENDSEQLNMILDSVIDYLRDLDEEIDIDSFRNDIKMHLLLTMKRKISKSKEQDNPILEQIKSNYAHHFEISCQIGDILHEKTGFEFTEDDIGYIAIYLFKNSGSKEEQQKFKVIIACATSRGTSQLLVTRITHVFPQIEVVGVMSITQINNTVDFKDVDFIISTAAIRPTSIPVVVVSILLNVKDIDQIQKLLTYGFSSKVISLPVNKDINDFTVKQFRELGIDYRNTYISMEKLTKIILGTLDVMVEIPSHYGVTQEKMLGLLIHLLLAVPRWLTGLSDNSEEYKKELQSVKNNHKHLYQQINVIFETIENELNTALTDSERLSFFDYIIEKEN